MPRKLALIGGGAALLVLLDAVLLVLHSRWQDEAEALVAANESNGTALSALQADLTEHEELRDLLSGQTETAQERVPELKGREASSIAEWHAIRDAVFALTECHDAQLDLIAYQWTSNINTGGLASEAAVRSQCTEAKNAFNAVKVDVDE